MKVDDSSVDGALDKNLKRIDEVEDLFDEDSIQLKKRVDISLEKKLRLEVADMRLSVLEQQLA